MNVRIVLWLIVALVLGVGMTTAYNHYMNLRDKAQLADSRGTVLETASGTMADGAVADQSAAAVETAVAGAADAFANAINEAKRNEPETADRADRRVPDSVRAAYRARRLARERSGCVQGECGSPGDDDATSER